MLQVRSEEVVLTLKPEIIKVVQEIALDLSIPISIVYGMVCQESTGITTATRFEPGFLKQYLLNLPFGDVGKKRRATSWGLMQIMGQTARERGFTEAFERLFVPELGVYWGCCHLLWLKGRYFKKYGWDGVIAAYNAGSPRFTLNGKYVNQYYVNKVNEYGKEAKCFM